MLASAAFKIPVAATAAGRLVAPEDATRGVRYRCPSCAGAVTLHAGARKARHYHHASSGCAVETVLHVSAKRLIVQAVEAWQAGGAAPVFARTCAEPGCEAATKQPMPRKIRRAVEELEVRSGHVVDVALLGLADLPVAAIEVLVTHEVDATKAFELGMPWIEVDAAAVCAERGRVLMPLRDRFLPWLCEAHVDRRGEALREERGARKTQNALVRALPYRLEEYPGYRITGTATCPSGHETLVFAWDGREPPWPRPPHVVASAKEEDQVYEATRKKMRGVLAFRHGWAIACVRCGAKLT